MAKATARDLFYQKACCKFDRNTVTVWLTEWYTRNYDTHYILTVNVKVDGKITADMEKSLVDGKLSDAVRKAIETFDELVERHPNNGELR